jgi:hypothetical protein
MDSIGLDENLYAPFRLVPAGIARQRRADPACEAIESNRQRQTGEKPPNELR